MKIVKFIAISITAGIALLSASFGFIYELLAIGFLGGRQHFHEFYNKNIENR